MTTYSIALILFLTALTPLPATVLRVLAWDEEMASREIFVVHGEKAGQVEDLHPTARSKPVDVPGDAADLRLEFRDSAGDEGAFPSVPITLPANASQVLAIVIPDPKTEAGARVLAVEDDLAGFAWGTIRVLNATGQPLVFTWEKKFKPLPASWTPVDVEPGGATRNMQVMLFMKDKPREPIYSAVWEHHLGQRQLVFVIPTGDASRGPVDFKIVPQRRIEFELPE